MMITRHKRNENSPLVKTTASTSTRNSIIVGSITTSTSGNTVVYGTNAKLPKEVSDRILRDAVRNHLRFLRACGRTHVTTEEIAKALSLSKTKVEQIAGGLRGVKVGA